MAAPTTATIQLITIPTRTQAMPIAKPIGQRLAPGRCCWSRFGSMVNDSVPRSTTHQSTRRRTLPHLPVPCSGIERDSVLRPAARHQVAGLGAHLDTGRPLPRPLLGSLVRRVDAELAAVELPCRRVVEVVERALAEHDVAHRVDVRADAEEHLL